MSSTIVVKIWRVTYQLVYQWVYVYWYAHKKGGNWMMCNVFNFSIFFVSVFSKIPYNSHNNTTFFLYQPIYFSLQTYTIILFPLWYHNCFSTMKLVLQWQTFVLLDNFYYKMHYIRYLSISITSITLTSMVFHNMFFFSRFFIWPETSLIRKGNN